MLYLEAGKFLTLADETRQWCAQRLWESRAALPDSTPFAAVATAIACTANVAPDIRTTLLQTTDRGTFWTPLPGAVATAARPEELQSIGAAVKDQRGMSSPPAWGKGATRHVPGAVAPPSRYPTPSMGTGALGAGAGAATAAAVPQPTAPPPPHRTHPATHPTRRRSRCPVRRARPRSRGSHRQPRPRPLNQPHGPTSPKFQSQRPLEGDVRAPPPPRATRMGSPDSCQLIIEVCGLSPETMSSSAVRDTLRVHLGSTKFVPLPSLEHGYEYVPCFEVVWLAFAGDETRALMPVMAAAGYVSVTLRPYRADGTLFSPPPEQG